MSTEPSAYGLSRLSDLTWPVTYRYRLQTVWGQSQHELSVDVPALANDAEATVRFGRSLWMMAVAGATSIATQMASIEARLHRSGTVEIAPMSPPVFGMQPAAPSSRSATPTVQFHSGHRDNFAMTRFPLIGAPSSWVNGGLVTGTGLRIIEQTMQRLKIAAAADLAGATFRLIIIHSGIDAEPPLDPGVAGWRPVEYIRCLWHTDRAPLPAL